MWDLVERKKEIRKKREKERERESKGKKKRKKEDRKRKGWRVAQTVAQRLPGMREALDPVPSTFPVPTGSQRPRSPEQRDCKSQSGGHPNCCRGAHLVKTPCTLLCCGPS